MAGGFKGARARTGADPRARPGPPHPHRVDSQRIGRRGLGQPAFFPGSRLPPYPPTSRPNLPPVSLAACTAQPKRKCGWIIFRTGCGLDSRGVPFPCWLRAGPAGLRRYGGNKTFVFFGFYSTQEIVGCACRGAGPRPWWNLRLAAPTLMERPLARAPGRRERPRRPGPGWIKEACARAHPCSLGGGENKFPGIASALCGAAGALLRAPGLTRRMALGASGAEGWHTPRRAAYSAS